jgi:hypothetical protein
MNKAEAKAILKERLDQYRARSYEVLATMVRSITTEEAAGPGGAKYQLEIDFRWDAKPNADVRVMGPSTTAACARFFR